MFAHLVPQGTPGALIPFIVLIETIRNVIRPGTLAVRLAANIIAGLEVVLAEKQLLLQVPPGLVNVERVDQEHGMENQRIRNEKSPSLTLANILTRQLG